MADEQSKQTGPKPGAPRAAESQASQAPQAAPTTKAKESAPNSLELERMRLENENLRMQNENLQMQLQIAETNKATAEINKAAADKASRNVMEEAQKKEFELVERLKAERERAREWREGGPRKFWVHLAHQLPVGTTLENPVLLIGGEHEHEAREKYKTALGIRRTPHEIAVVPAVDGEPCPVAEVMRLAMEGYQPESI